MICCAVFQLPGLTALPPIDRDEARFAGATYRMLAGDGWRSWVVPEFGDRIRINKPPLVYWIQAPLVKLTRLVYPPPPINADAGPAADAGAALLFDPGLPDGSIWRYRLTSVFGALAAAVLTWRLGLHMFAPPAAWLGGLLLGSCALVMFDVRQARADQLLLAFTVLTQLAMWHIWRQAQSETTSRRWVIAFWVAVALGTLTKGPVTPAIAGLTIFGLAVFGRDSRWLRHVHLGYGLLLVIVLITPWIVMVGAAVGWERLGLTILQETLGRTVRAAEGHGGLPGYHLVLLPILLWPGSLALVPGIGRGFERALRLGRHGTWWRRWGARTPGRPAEVFLLAWLIPGWLTFELIGTKLPHYTMPLYPALALLCARGLFDFRRGWQPVYATWWGRGALVGWALLAELFVVGVPIGLAWFGGLPRVPAVLVTMGLAVAVGQALVVWLVWAIWQRRIRRAQCIALAAAAVFAVLIFQIALPNARHVWLSARICQHLRHGDADTTRPVADVAYHADSLVFLTHGRITRIELDELNRWWQVHPDGLAIVAQPISAQASMLAEESGFDYSRGRWLDLAIVQSGGEAATGDE